jgi:hypothetical protein
MKPKYITWEKRDRLLMCLHHKQFPPPQALPLVVEEMGTIEQQRANGTLKGTQYQRILVWQKECGKFEMDGGCLKCPLCRIKSNHPIFGDKLQELPSLLTRLTEFPKD